MTTKLLIVDDSAFMRSIIRELAGNIGNIEVVGVARDGLDALESLEYYKPDIITLDVEMPKLNGIETLKRIKEKYEIPVLMISSVSNADITIEALEIGAEDFIVKPDLENGGLEKFQKKLKEKIDSILKSKLNEKEEYNFNNKKNRNRLNKIDAVCIAASAGGPKTLVEIIKNIPKEVEIPIFIVQHMPEGFTTSFAERLNTLSKIEVVEARDKELILGGKIYLSPGNYHMEIKNKRIELNKKEKIHGVRPAADYMFKSASEIYKDNLLGIILTGMGKDGTKGMGYVKEKGGYNIAQNKESCTVYGMPRSAVLAGVIDETMSLKEIIDYLYQSIRVKK